MNVPSGVNFFSFCIIADCVVLYNQILFPYDEFVELFNWAKPGFSPCGLVNCGNRFELLKCF